MRWLPFGPSLTTALSRALRAYAPIVLLFLSLHLGLDSPHLGLASPLDGAHAATDDIFQPNFAHWNIRGRYSRDSAGQVEDDRYNTVYNFLFPGPQAQWPANEGGDVEVLMLQETSRLPHETNDPNWSPNMPATEEVWRSEFIDYAGGYDSTMQTGYRSMTAQIRVASWEISDETTYYWYLLEVNTSATNAMNLAIITDEPADRIIFIPPVYWEAGTNTEGNRSLGPRPYLGVQFNDKYSEPVAFYTFHAKSGVDQNDLKTLFGALHAIHTDKSQLATAQNGTKLLAPSHTTGENQAKVDSWSRNPSTGQYQKDPDGTHTNTNVKKYLAGGDANRNLIGEPAHANKRRKAGVNGKPQRLYYPDKQTRKGSIIDYAITCGLQTRYTPRRSTVLNNPNDHWGVIYDGFTWYEWLRAATLGLADPSQLPAYNHQSGGPHPPREDVHRNLHGAHARAYIVGLEGELDTVQGDGATNETKFLRAATLQAENATSHTAQFFEEDDGTSEGAYGAEGGGLLYFRPGTTATLAKLDVVYSGSVVVDLRYAATQDRTIKLYFVHPDGTESSETVSLPSTGAWGTWDHATVTLETVSGVNLLKVDANQAYFDLDSFDIAAVEPSYRGSEAVATNTSGSTYQTYSFRFGSTIGESARWINMANADGLSHKEYKISFANGSSADIVMNIQIFDSKGNSIWSNSSVRFAPTGSWTTWHHKTLWYGSSSEPPLSGSVTMKMTLVSGVGPKIYFVRIEPQSSKLHFHEATQRSNYGGNAGFAEFAIARLNDTRWDGNQSRNTVTHTDNWTDNWWQGKLDDVRVIKKLVLHNRTDCCQYRLADFHVFFAKTDMSNGPGQPLSLDDAAGRSDFSYFHQGQVWDQKTIDIESHYPVPVEAKYILIYKGEDEFLSLGEVEAYGHHDEL